MCVCVYLSECFLWVLCKSSTGRKLYSWSSRENMGKTRMNGIAYMCVSVLLMLCSPLLSSPLWKSIFFFFSCSLNDVMRCVLYLYVCVHIHLISFDTASNDHLSSYFTKIQCGVKEMLVSPKQYQLSFFPLMLDFSKAQRLPLWKKNLRIWIQLAMAIGSSVRGKIQQMNWGIIKTFDRLGE